MSKPTVDRTRGVRLGVQLTHKMLSLRDRETEHGAQRRALMYLLNREAGVTYRQLAAELGLSNRRVIDELTKARREIEELRDPDQRRELKRLREQLRPTR